MPTLRSSHHVAARRYGLSPTAWLAAMLACSTVACSTVACSGAAPRPIPHEATPTVAAIAAPAPPLPPTPRCEPPITGTPNEATYRDLLGKDAEEPARRGGDLQCRSDTILQFRFGTWCGNFSTYHDVVTVELHEGRITQVWSYQKYNDAFCE